MIVWHFQFGVESGLAIGFTVSHGLIRTELWLGSCTHNNLSSSPRCYMDQIKWLTWASIRQQIICYRGMAIMAIHNTEKGGWKTLIPTRNCVVIMKPLWLGFIAWGFIIGIKLLCVHVCTHSLKAAPFVIAIFQEQCFKSINLFLFWRTSVENRKAVLAITQLLYSNHTKLMILLLVPLCHLYLNKLALIQSRRCVTRWYLTWLASRGLYENTVWARNTQPYSLHYTIQALYFRPLVVLLL